MQKADLPAHSALNLATSLTALASDAALFQRPSHGRLRELMLQAADPANDQARMTLAAFQFEMERGHQLLFLEPNSAESRDDFRARSHLRTLNLTRVVIDVLSGLYRQHVVRKYEGTPAAVELFTSTPWQESTANAMETCDRLARLQGTCAVQVVVRNGVPSLRVIPAHRLAVIEDDSDPTRAEAVIITGRGARWKPGLRRSMPDYADIWTPSHYRRVERGVVIAETRHEYGRVPLIFVRDTEPVTGFWADGRGLSLCYDNAVLNQRLTDLAEVVAMQGFGVMEVVNPDESQEFAVGPSRAMVFRANGNLPYGVNFKHTNAPIAELVAEIETSIRHILLTQRIPEHAISVNVTGNASGVSIEAANSPITEDRQGRARRFGRIERDLHKLAATVLNVHRPELNASDTRLMVDFPEPATARSLSEQRAHDQWQIDHGMTTPWALMHRDNPDAWPTPEDARPVWEANRRALANLNLPAPISPEEGTNSDA